MAETLAPFDEDNIIPAFGFGDLISKHRSVFPLSLQVSYNDDHSTQRVGLALGLQIIPTL